MPPEQTTLPREYRHSVLLSDGTVIAQDEWDALRPPGGLPCCPAGGLRIEVKKVS